jgi:predicted RNA-binding protein with PIN domain
LRSRENRVTRIINNLASDAQPAKRQKNHPACLKSTSDEIKQVLAIMHIIIDGYNLIRQSDTLRRYERISLEDGRKALIHSISLYKKQRGHKVTVVFDGWQGGPHEEERDKLSGIDIIYSRKGEKADEVIKRMVQERAEEIVVVTSDRDIADFVSRRGGTAISSPEFDELMERAKSPMTDPARHTEERSDKEEDDAAKGGIKKKGSSRRLSRRKKAAMVRIRKL